MSTTLDSLTKQVDQLHSLLHDPQPGLFMWNEAVRDSLKGINAIWQAPKTAGPLEVLKAIARDAEEVAELPETAGGERRAWKAIANMARKGIADAS